MDFRLYYFSCFILCFSNHNILTSGTVSSQTYYWEFDLRLTWFTWMENRACAQINYTTVSLDIYEIKVQLCDEKFENCAKTSDSYYHPYFVWLNVTVKTELDDGHCQVDIDLDQDEHDYSFAFKRIEYRAGLTFLKMSIHATLTTNKRNPHDFYIEEKREEMAFSGRVLHDTMRQISQKSNDSNFVPIMLKFDGVYRCPEGRHGKFCEIQCWSRNYYPIRQDFLDGCKRRYPQQTEGVCKKYCVADTNSHCNKCGVKECDTGYYLKNPSEQTSETGNKVPFDCEEITCTTPNTTKCMHDAQCMDSAKLEPTNAFYWCNCLTISNDSVHFDGLQCENVIKVTDEGKMTTSGASSAESSTTTTAGTTTTTSSSTSGTTTVEMTTKSTAKTTKKEKTTTPKISSTLTESKKTTKTNSENFTKIESSEGSNFGITVAIVLVCLAFAVFVVFIAVKVYRQYQILSVMPNAYTIENRGNNSTNVSVSMATNNHNTVHDSEIHFENPTFNPIP